MTREEAKALLPIIRAYIEGKVIQVKCKTDSKALTEEWIDVVNPDLDDSRCYRIKPEPKYRPFKNAEECWQEMQKHQPFGWVKASHGYFFVMGVRTDEVCFGAKENFMNYDYLYDEYTFADGTPFGIKEED